VNSIKSAAVLGIVAAIGVALFMKMNGGPEPEPPEEFAGSWGPPAVEMSPPGAGFPAGPSGGLSDATDESMRGEYRSAPAPFPADHRFSAPQKPGTMERQFLNGPTGETALPRGPMDPETGPQRDLGSETVSSERTPDDSASRAAPGASSPAANGADGPAARAPVWADVREESAADGTAAESAGASSWPTGSPGEATLHGSAASSAPGGGLSDSPAGGAGPADHSPAGSPFSLARSAAEEILDRGDLAQAHLLLSRWYDDPSLSDGERGELVSLLGQLAGTVIYSTEHHLEPAYQVQGGETLEAVAERYRVPWQLLARINGLASPEDAERAGTLKVIRGPFSAWINLTRREMVLMVGGYYAGRFRVGVGSERPDLEGNWVVRHKAINPTYYGRDRVIDAEDPGNPLGEYWLGLAGAQDHDTVAPFGIHGTYDATSLDRDDPRGYIRLAPEDIRDVYDILSVGSRVTIRR
jgi:hypothetical protein